MIEVERKVELTPEILSYLSDKKIHETKRIRDIYYDTPTYTYTSQNIWLRERDNDFELKRGIQGSDYYEEIVDPTKIASVLNIAWEKDLRRSLALAQLFPFASFETLRKKHRLEEFCIDVDIADFGDFVYEIAEVECLVEKESEIAEAESKINTFLKSFGIDLAQKPPAKLTAYLSRERPDHFKILQEAKVL